MRRVVVVGCFHCLTALKEVERQGGRLFPRRRPRRFYEYNLYIHNGITSGITNSFPCPDITPAGLATDGTNLISGDNGTYGVEDDKFYLHSGVTSGITTTFDAPSGYKRIGDLTYKS